MKPELSPLRISIVDFMGVLLPGIIWVILLLSLEELFDQAPTLADPNPLALGVRIFGFGDATGLGSSGAFPVSMDFAHYAGFAVSALMLGYILKPLTAWVADKISYVWDRVLSLARVPGGGRPAERVADLAFPFDAVHSGTPYHNRILSLIRRQSGIEAKDLPSSQPLIACKSLLRAHARSLWEDVEHVEGEVTLVGSLFVACLFSLIVALVKVILHRWPLPPTLGWLATSALLATVLFSSYRHLRRQEVDRVYTNTLLASHLIEGKPGDA